MNDLRTSFYRDKQNAKLMGICAGIADYTGVNAMWIRLGFFGLVIARPSFLAGDREALGQPVRSGETLALNVSQWLRPLIPKNYRSIAASDVAAGLLRNVPHAAGVRVLSSGEMQR